jgi:hypothetical protein
MGVRKNVKFLDSTERENFVKACVLMKADIVNPAAAPADRYSRWDESVAIHRMIQNANAPGNNNVNFGHGGLGAYSFLSWHRYFLYRFELQLRSYLPMGTDFNLPYWDWTDPASSMTDDFLGPDGAGGTTIVGSGYFAEFAPSTGTNPTPSPAWWPAGLTGWNLHAAFGTLAGPLKRDLMPAGQLPSASDIITCLARTTYSGFQNTLESGAGVVSQMHNGIHGWLGGHMATLTGSPFDPFFYLHHCNIDRLWAMWQLDGHATLYPAMGAKPKHGPTDAMYPWVGPDAALYTSNFNFAPIVMPDFSAVGTIRNVDVLDHRALGYTYDTLAVIGIGLDRTGSMTGLTPDPMTGIGTVTKWEAATRGVSAFLQDCETVQASGVIYVNAGIKSFRSLPANDFAPVFGAPSYGLIKNGSSFSKAVFDATIGGWSPGGGTPLADALTDVENTLVAPPFGWLPADEQRYLAILTDGMLTSGAPMASIPDNSWPNTAIFAMGFGTPAEVDYPTLSSMVAKGRTLSFDQVFHGESAGVIDKFYSNALARAIGFSTIFDPVLELFAGEHTHLEFYATSAEERFFITAQGMDFEDSNWSFHLEGPDGATVYGDGIHEHAGAPGHGGRTPHVTVRRGDGRLSLMLQRDSAPASTWVGKWTLMVAYRARDLSAMVMVDAGELMFPVAAGPVRGPRYSRLLQPAEKRLAARAVPGAPRHAFDIRPASTNNSTNQASSILVNIYACTRMRIELGASKQLIATGEGAKFDIHPDLLRGSIANTRSFARLVAPANDIAAVVARVQPKDIPKEAELKGSLSLRFDPARVLAQLETENPKVGHVRDEAVAVVAHGGPAHIHLEKLDVAGAHHVGVYMEGAYCPDVTAPAGEEGHGHDHAAPDAGKPGAKCEHFVRLFNSSVGVAKG